VDNSVSFDVVWAEALALRAQLAEAQAEAREYQQACDRMAAEHKVERDALRLENADHIQQLRKEQMTVQRLREALEKISNWGSHDNQLAINFGSNGVRDWYRSQATKALKGDV